MEENQIIEQKELKKAGRGETKKISRVYFFMGFVALFFIIQGFLLLKNHSVSAYNIGIPDSDNVTGTYKGIVLLNETPVTVDRDGEVLFYASLGEWVSKGNYLITVDKEGNLTKTLREHFYGLDTLSYDSRLEIQKAVKSAVSEYDATDFSTVHSAKEHIDEMVFRSLLRDGGEDAKEFLGSMDLFAFEAPESGFFLNWIDGLEGKDVSELTGAELRGQNHQVKPVTNGDKVSRDEPVVKLVTDNKMVIAFPLTEAEARKYQTKASLTIKTRENLRITGTFSLGETVDGVRMGILTFPKYAANFLTERYTEFQILDNTVTGYKIPESAIVTKEMLVVPADFVMVGQENGIDKKGFMAEVNGKFSFCTDCTIYEKSANPDNNFVRGENVVYVVSNTLKPGTRIQKEGDAAEITTITMTDVVEGVYQINSGYCVFKPIVRLQNSLDTSYIVISDGVRGGLKAYDRIVTDVTNLKENEIIFE